MGVKIKVPFNSPVILEDSFEHLRQSLENRHLSGLGPFTKQTEAHLDRLTQTSNLVVTSATHALEMMGLLLDIKPGDEVIIPSFTFVSTANAFILRGAKVRFADNDEYGNIKISEVERLLSPKTKAVMAVHYAGNSADLEHLIAVCKSAQVPLLEDAAQAIGSTFKGKALGSLGDLGCISFHETKNIGSGEGGSLLVNQKKLLERAEIIREKGTNRKLFFQGLVDKYTWVDVGSSYVLSDLNVAFLYPQLLRLQEINQRRIEICRHYRSQLAAPFAKIGARVLETPVHNDNPNGHLFAIVFSNPEHRVRFISWMSEHLISCPFHYVSLHTSPFGRVASAGGLVEELAGCDSLSKGLVRFPLFYNMTQEQLEHTITTAQQWILRQ
jgi:dTDP-4-amino-4,6-dideoxygalactose transaminase